jgi:hypothetical protein
MKQSKIKKTSVLFSFVFLSSVSFLSHADSFLLLRNNNSNDNGKPEISILRHGTEQPAILPKPPVSTVKPIATHSSSEISAAIPIISQKKVLVTPPAVPIRGIEKNKKNGDTNKTVKPINIYSSAKQNRATSTSNNVITKPPVNIKATGKTSYFTMKKGVTVRDNLKRWAKISGWRVLWRMPTTWVVPSSATFNGPFKAATEDAVRALYFSGKNIYAAFWNKNNTVIITGTGDKK